jgi:hypothetical protein
MISANPEDEVSTGLERSMDFAEGVGSDVEDLARK